MFLSSKEISQHGSTINVYHENENDFGKIKDLGYNSKPNLNLIGNCDKQTLHREHKISDKISIYQNHNS